MKVKRSVDGKIEGSGGSGARHGSASRTVTGTQRSFGASVEDAMEELDVRELLESLGVISGKLTVFPAESLIMEYRRIIKELLARAMKGYSLQRDLRWRRTDRNLYVTIEKTENALAELEKAFNHESGRTRALQLMEEIKGCIMSLLF
ncbi:hypothetical protein FACS1894204_01530 [Synergistales bacterium]|nr:hypothetical protein FACS1894204_01530 [Synergistales bacterium]